MAEQQTFRTAFNGFNRDDVVHYIEYLNAKHVAEINQLNSELEFLRSQQAAVEIPEETTAVQPVPGADESVLAQQASRIRELFDQNKDLESRCQALRKENEESRSLLADAQAEKDKLSARLDEALQQQSSFKSHVEAELEAYRRAENTERVAKERAEQLYRQANGALADATLKVDDAACQIGHLTDRVMNQLGELQNAVTSSKQALRDAAATMYTIRPTNTASK